jgi:hypothetical protein
VIFEGVSIGVDLLSFVSDVSVPGWPDGVGEDDCLVGRSAAQAASGAVQRFQPGKLTYLFVLLFRFSWVIGAKDKHASFAMLRNTAADYRPPNAWLGRPHMDIEI